MPRTHEHQAGIDLLDRYVKELQQRGYRRLRVDTLTNDRVQVRHHYDANTWELTATRAPSWLVTRGGDSRKVTYSTWTPDGTEPKPLPTVDELIEQTIGGWDGR